MTRREPTIECSLARILDGIFIFAVGLVVMLAGTVGWTVYLIATAPDTATGSPVVSAQPAVNGKWWGGDPPMRFRGDAFFQVNFIPEALVNDACATPGYPVPKGKVIVACKRHGFLGPVVTMPNPCEFMFDSYARVLCHELGHVNGWGGQHED